MAFIFVQLITARLAFDPCEDITHVSMSAKVNVRRSRAEVGKSGKITPSDLKVKILGFKDG